MIYKFIHIADIHADGDPVKKEKLAHSLEQLIEYCSEVKINAIIIAGDVWEKKQSFDDKNSGVPMMLNYLKRLAELVDFVFIVKGNNSHDEPGSIALLHQLCPNIYAYEHPALLATSSHEVGTGRLWAPVSNLLESAVMNGEIDFIIQLIPYPTKANFILDDSIDNNNAAFLEKFESVFELMGQISDEYDCPKLMAAHLNVQGSRLSSGQTLVSQDILVAPSTIEKAKADYYALGHIHLRQFFKPNMGYSGSLYNKSWGETEQKSFEVITFDTDVVNPEVPKGAINPQMTIETVPLTAARAMITVDFEIDDIGLNRLTDLSAHSNEVIENAEFRLRIKVSENNRNLLTDEKLDILSKDFNNTDKIEIVVVPNERESRSEEIMSCTTLLDEVREYAAVIEESITPSIETKVTNLQEQESEATL